MFILSCAIIRYLRVSKSFIEYMYVLFYREWSDVIQNKKDLFEDAIEHKNPNHQCSYFGSECPYKGIEFLEKVEVKVMSDETSHLFVDDTSSEWESDDASESEYDGEEGNYDGEELEAYSEYSDVVSDEDHSSSEN